MVSFPENVFFALVMRFFGKKSENFERWKLEKLENMIRKRKYAFSRKNVFLFLEAFSYKKEKAQNMPEVAGRRLIYLTALTQTPFEQGTKKTHGYLY